MHTPAERALLGEDILIITPDEPHRNSLDFSRRRCDARIVRVGYLKRGPKRVKFGKDPALRRFSVVWVVIFRISTRFARHSPDASWWAVIRTSCPLTRQSELQLCRWL